MKSIVPVNRDETKFAKIDKDIKPEETDNVLTRLVIGIICLFIIVGVIWSLGYLRDDIKTKKDSIVSRNLSK